MNYLIAMQQHFVAHKNEVYASAMRAYMKDKFQYLGIKAPERKRLLASFLKIHGKPSREEIENIVVGLWNLPHREYQYCGMELADKILKKPIEEDILLTCLNISNGGILLILLPVT